MRKITKVGVIGSGVMGAGITALMASAGIETILLDIVPPDLTDDEKKDPKNRNRLVLNSLKSMVTGKPAALMSPEDAARIFIGNLEDDFYKLGQCDWIIEAVVENLQIKIDLFRRIDKIRKERAVITSNTSGIPLSAITQDLSPNFCRHFFGSHFFNPVRYMHLLELIPGKETLPEVIETISRFGEKVLGKGIVLAKDTPNFIGNRIGVHASMHAIQTMMEDKMTIPEVDALTGTALGRPKMATFMLTDLVGLDTVGHVTSNSYDLLTEDECRNAYQLPSFYQAMIDKKMLGNKTKGGFYKKIKDDTGKKKRLVINPETLEYETFEKPEFDCLTAAGTAHTPAEKLKAVINGTDKGAVYAWKVLAGHLIYSANRIPEISDTIVEIDHAMTWGYNYQMGPFEAWDAIGLFESVDRMKKDGMAVPENILAMISGGNETFYKLENGSQYYYDFQSQAYQPVPADESSINLSNLKSSDRTVKQEPCASLVDLGDGVFCCEFHTKMNTLDSKLIKFINDSIDYVEAHGRGLVIGNQAAGPNPVFCAGANLIEFITAVSKGSYDSMADSLENVQSAVQKMRYASFPVVAAPYGMTLGGGCEICLGADRIVAHAELYMGLVELGVGLIPSGGGCLNLWKKFITTLPKAVTKVNLWDYFLPVFNTIFMAKVSTSAAHARSMGFLGQSDRIVFNKAHLIGEAKKEVLRMVDDHYTPEVRNKIRVFGDAGRGLANVMLNDMVTAGHITEYEAFMGKKLAHVISGGDVRVDTQLDEDIILELEKLTFIELLKQESTQQRIHHMLETGRPLRN